MYNLLKVVGCIINARFRTSFGGGGGGGLSGLILIRIFSYNKTYSAVLMLGPACFFDKITQRSISKKFLEKFCPFIEIFLIHPSQEKHSMGL